MSKVDYVKEYPVFLGLGLTALILVVIIFWGVIKNHPEAITAFATIVLVSVTALLVLATKQLSDVTKKMWLAQDRPLLKFYIKRYGESSPVPISYLYVKNVGKGPALDILFNIYLGNKLEPLPIRISLLYIKEETAIKQLAGSGTIEIEDLIYNDINEIECIQEVDNLDY